MFYKTTKLAKTASTMEDGIWGNINQQSGARNSQNSSRIKYLSFPLRYDCSWRLAPHGYFSKGILVASQKVSYPYISSHRICGSSSKVWQPQGCLGRNTVASYKVTVLHREDRGQDTVSMHTCLGFTVFPQSNGSQHRATPPKLTLSSVRISVLGIWVSTIQRAEGPEILLQISSEQSLGQWNIMHQMLTELKGENL